MDILHSLVQMKYVQAKVPQQDNNCDCSLYVLHYIEVFLSKSASQDLSFLSSERGANFTRQDFEMEVFDKRNYIQGLIFELGGMVKVQDGNLSNTQAKRRDKVGSRHFLKREHQSSPKLAKQTKSKKWKEIETSILLQCMVDGNHFCNGKDGAMHWDLIAEAINLKNNGGPLRYKEQCQNRFDTLLKAYKGLNAYCEETGKKFCEVTNEEKQALKLATPLEKNNEGWYNNLHTIYCWRSSLRSKGGKRQKLNLGGDIEKCKLTSSAFKLLGECSTPLNLIRSLESRKTSSRQAAFVKARDHQLPSLTQLPSSAWIPEYRSHNTSTDKMTSFEPRDINSGFEVTPTGTSFPTSNFIGWYKHRWSDARTNPRICIPPNNKPQTPPRSGRKSGVSQIQGLRCKRNSNKWVLKMRGKALNVKTWLGTFGAEQAAVAAISLGRELLMCKWKYPPNLSCEKLQTHSWSIPPHLNLTDLTDTSTFKEVTFLIQRKCKEYAALLDDTPSEQIIPAFNERDSPIFGGQFLSPTSSINQAAQWFENMFPSESSDALDVDDHLEWDRILALLEEGGDCNVF